LSESRSQFALFNYGFRPFFLLAGLYAVIAMMLWLLALLLEVRLAADQPAYLWHGHEMLFGFISAAITGFLLTAVPSWTGQRGFSGLPLIILAIVWLSGRLLFIFQAYSPPALIMAVDLAFFPLLVLMLAPSLLRGKSRNLVFILFLLLLFVSNLIFHQATGLNDFALASNGLLLGINTVLLIIAIIGGRIVPAFTLSAMRRTDETFSIKPFPALDRAAIFSIALILLIDLIWPSSQVAGWLAILTAVIHAGRFLRWKTWRCLNEAIVWILHIGYAWLIIGLALKGIFLLTGMAFSTAWLHALTSGLFATMILAVMTRAALGHTGRPLIAPPLIAAAYVLITLAAIVRVSGPLFPSIYLYSITIAGGLWIGAFTLFLIVYAPILVMPRADGKPG
jgi:uncharacterized protein involved in response to NO